MSETLRSFANAAAAMAVNMSRPDYFESGRKGEVFELREDLNSDTTFMRKEAMKKVVAGMTIGKDFSPLFPDVLKCMQTTNLELKKLVYLYLVNYSKSQPELAILAINTFCKDSEDTNPLVRSLAIRTMGCIRIPQILDYLIEPLRRGLKDPHPYVRKSAALCVAKVFDLSPEIGEECGFLDNLQELLRTDSNPMVISNVLAALADITEQCPGMEVLQLDEQLLKRLLGILNDCTEWGQIFILEALARYQASVVEEAERIIEAVLPRLQHDNQAIVMAAIRVLVALALAAGDDCPLPGKHPLKTVVRRKLGAPLVAMTSAPTSPEIQYAALRCLGLLIQLDSSIIGSDPRPFFASYSDPGYVKNEKLEVLGMVADDESIGRILPELADCAKDVDSALAAKAVKIMARVAERVTHWTGHVLDLFTSLLETQIPPTVQQVMIAVADLFRAARLPGIKETLKAWIHRTILVNDSVVGFDSICLACEGDPEAQAAVIFLLSSVDILELDETDAEGGESEWRPLAALISYIQALSQNFVLSPCLLQEELVLSAVRLACRHSRNRALRQLVDTLFELASSEGESIEMRDRCCWLAKLFEKKKLEEPSSAFSPSSAKSPTEPAFYFPSEGFSDGFASGSEEANAVVASTTVASATAILEKILFGDEGEMSAASYSLEEEHPSSFISPELLTMLVSELSLLSSIVYKPAGRLLSSNTSPSASLKASAATLPAVYRQLLMTSRPAVANILALDYSQNTDSAAEEAEKAAAKSPKPIDLATQNPVEKYANLLDLLD